MIIDYSLYLHLWKFKYLPFSIFVTILGGINNSPQSRYDEWDYAVPGLRHKTNTNDSFSLFLDLLISPIHPFPQWNSSPTYWILLNDPHSPIFLKITPTDPIWSMLVISLAIFSNTCSARVPLIALLRTKKTYSIIFYLFLLLKYLQCSCASDCTSGDSKK